MKQIQQYPFFTREDPSEKVKAIHKESDLLTLIEAANRLRISPATLQRWAKSGRIEAVRLPKRAPYVYVRKAVIDAILTSSPL
jgi:excisionase family DNA binding protein